jgi:hypothetical protein
VTTSWKYEQDVAGVVQRETTFPDATNTTTVVERPHPTTDISNAVGTATYPSTEHIEETPDPRWGMAARRRTRGRSWKP